MTKKAHAKAATEAQAEAEAEAQAEAEAEVKLVKMVHDDGTFADVHPAEVENFKSGGYREA